MRNNRVATIFLLGAVGGLAAMYFLAEWSATQVRKVQEEIPEAWKSILK